MLKIETAEEMKSLVRSRLADHGWTLEFGGTGLARKSYATAAGANAKRWFT